MKVTLKHWCVLGVTGFGLSLLTAQLIASHHSDSHFTTDSDAINASSVNPSPVSTSAWIVSAEQAQTLVQQGATVLDTRPESRWAIRRIRGTVTVRWQDFSQTPSSQRGNLLVDDTSLNRKLQALGISESQPVIVIGDAINGWGEEGRIVWMLRTLGHPHAFMVDGGHQAIQTQGILSSTWRTVPPPSNFMIQRNTTWLVGKDELKASLKGGTAIVIDAREKREYAGATPYGETRGGHIPGAIHLHYRELLDETGHLLPEGQILDLLAAKGIGSDQPLIIYCTGGVRSAWLTAVLSDLGFQARNYAGSMWEWSAYPADQYPLEKPQPE